MSEQAQQSADRTDDTRQDGDVGATRDDEAVSRFVERFASQLVEAGMQRMSARVFACLLASDSGVLTSAELGERLQVSPAAVSGAIRYLSQVDMVSREREPGSRRDRYRVHSDQWYEALARRDNVLTRWEGTLREGVDSLGEDSPAGRRIAETVIFFEFLQKELAGLLQRWREHRDQMRADLESADR
ncbi:MarR family transcriptional regulator [Streptomyces sp. NEAU-S7GS2]|uniref:GbsR/MarR family transcriptional regulator n=1 Tax=Streptomyces sp. NEAU-S7GS2 TaxID=2202000 RepID=UPI000D704B2A|nr:MarR family transcriptional regulator [Streptomyces sp. NEAU-S7GS2]AWN28106.1 MarR family transcriptional regulator [Streptomyces sp. NEAU-S7GS2]